MRVIRDMAGGGRPMPMDLFFNASLDADGGATCYKGQLTKVMDIADVDNGRFLTTNVVATVGLNIFGILEENIAPGATDGYLADDATYGMIRRKITPVFPTSLVRAEYEQADAAAAVNYETLLAASAGVTVTASAITTDDLLIGGWIYWITGSNAGQLHYITNSGQASNDITLATATPQAMAAADHVLIILPAFVDEVDFNATQTGIKSDTDDGNWTDEVVGIDHWITAPGVSMTRLDRNIHDGICIPNAKFYHDFAIVENSVWVASTQ